MIINHLNIADFLQFIHFNLSFTRLWSTRFLSSIINSLLNLSLFPLFSFKPQQDQITHSPINFHAIPKGILLFYAANRERERLTKCNSPKHFSNFLFIISPLWTCSASSLSLARVYFMSFIALGEWN